MRSREHVGGAFVADEDTFALPESWRRALHPRRGGVPRPVELDGDAAGEVAQWTKNAESLIRGVLHHRDSDPELLTDVNAQLDGEASPRGAAMLGQIVAASAHLDTRRFGDAWVSAYGLTFAAEAIAELCETQVDWFGHGRSERLIRFRPAGVGLGWRWHWLPAAARVRALLAGADDGEYRAAVEALAGHRRTVPCTP